MLVTNQDCPPLLTNVKVGSERAELRFFSPTDFPYNVQYIHQHLSSTCKVTVFKSPTQVLPGNWGLNCQYWASAMKQKQECKDTSTLAQSSGSPQKELNGCSWGPMIHTIGILRVSLFTSESSPVDWIHLGNWRTSSDLVSFKSNPTYSPQNYVRMKKNAVQRGQ